MVKQVEGLHAELQVDPLARLDVFEQRKVELVVARTPESVSTQVGIKGGVGAGRGLVGPGWYRRGLARQRIGSTAIERSGGKVLAWMATLKGSIHVRRAVAEGRLVGPVVGDAVCVEIAALRAA